MSIDDDETIATRKNNLDDIVNKATACGLMISLWLVYIVDNRDQSDAA